MADDETAACAWCGSAEVEHLVMCSTITAGQGPVQRVLLCAGCASAAARFLFNVAWRARMNGAVALALAFAHGYKLEEEVSPC